MQLDVMYTYVLHTGEREGVIRIPIDIYNTIVSHKIILHIVTSQPSIYKVSASVLGHRNSN